MAFLTISLCAQLTARDRGAYPQPCRRARLLRRPCVGLRPNFTPETSPGVTADDVAQLVHDALLGRLPRLHEVAAAAVYAASDAAGAMTGAVLNLSCGAVFG